MAVCTRPVFDTTGLRLPWMDRDLPNIILHRATTDTAGDNRITQLSENRAPHNGRLQQSHGFA